MNIKYILTIASMFFIAGGLQASMGTALLPDTGRHQAEPVQFLIDGKLYDGNLEVGMNNRLRVDIMRSSDNDAEPLPSDNYRDVLLERLDGYLVPSHQDVGLDVYLLGESDGIAFRYGVIEAVYDNGYHKIGVYSESYHNGETIHLFKPDYLIIHKAVLLQDGGFGILK